MSETSLKWDTHRLVELYGSILQERDNRLAELSPPTRRTCKPATERSAKAKHKFLQIMILLIFVVVVVVVVVVDSQVPF